MNTTFSFYADGTYRYVNNVFAKGVGKTSDEIIGRKIWNVFEKWIEYHNSSIFNLDIAAKGTKMRKSRFILYVISIGYKIDMPKF